MGRSISRGPTAAKQRVVAAAAPTSALRAAAPTSAAPSAVVVPRARRRAPSPSAPAAAAAAGSAWGAGAGGGGLLHYAAAAALSPHARRNAHIRTRYAVHASLWDAVVGFVAGPVHNETLNAATGAASLAVAAWLWRSAGGDGASSPADAWRLRALAGWLGVQACAVVAYHTLLSVPAWYDVTSAVDLAGIALLCCGLFATAHIPGMSAAHAGLAPDAARAVYALEAALVAAGAAGAVAARLRLRRESPPALLALNCAWYVPIVADFALAAWPEPAAVLAPALLVGGLALYALRLPERLVPHVACDVFNSHTAWHCAYTASVTVYAGHALVCAARNAAGAAARGAGEL